MKVKLSSFAPLLLALTLMGCSGPETKDPNGSGNPDGTPGETIDQPSVVDATNLSGRWVRSSSDGGEVLFDCIDAGATLTLKRVLTEKESFLVSFDVELEREGPELNGVARFLYTEAVDPSNKEYSLAWKLTEKSELVYDARCEVYDENEDAKEPTFENYTFTITPTAPKIDIDDPRNSPSAPVENGSTPSATIPSGPVPSLGGLAVPGNAPVNEGAVKAQLAELFSDDDAKSAAAMAALSKEGASADRIIEDASYEETSPAKRARAGLLLALRQNPAGLTTLQEVRADSSSLGITESEEVDRMYKLGVGCLVPIKDLDRSPATVAKVVGNRSGPEALAWSKKVEENKPELAVIGWLKSENQRERRIAEAILFPNGTTLGGRYGGQNYSGEIYNSLDDKGRRDAAADEFTKWFDANARSKLSN